MGFEISLNDLNLFIKWIEIWQEDLIWDLPITGSAILCYFICDQIVWYFSSIFEDAFEPTLFRIWSYLDYNGSMIALCPAQIWGDSVSRYVGVGPPKTDETICLFVINSSFAYLPTVLKLAGWCGMIPWRLGNFKNPLQVKPKMAADNIQQFPHYMH